MVLHEYTASGTTPIISDVNTNSSEAYSFSYSGGPFFSYAELNVFVDPGQNANPLPGTDCVDSFDAALAQEHYLDSITLTGVQLIAADVNMDGHVDNTDVQMIQDVWLGNTSTFDNSLTVDGNTYSDRAVIYPTTESVSTVTEPIALSYSYDYIDPNIPSGSTTGKNFNSIRLGDVNGDCGTYWARQTGEAGTDFSKLSQEINPENNTVIYPNPVVDNLTIYSPNKYIFRVEILNLRGEVLYTTGMKNEVKKFSLSAEHLSKIASGMYAASIYLEDGSTVTKKFVKKEK
jgi:hypothetical protein